MTDEQKRSLANYMKHLTTEDAEEIANQVDHRINVSLNEAGL